MSVVSTMLRCVASVGGSFAKMRSGRPAAGGQAMRSIARPVVPLWAPATTTDSARAPRVAESHAGVIASGVAGSTSGMAGPSSRYPSPSRGADGPSTIRMSPIREGATMNRAQSLLSEINPSIPQPLAPDTVHESGLDPQFLLRFVLKSIYVTNFETAEAHADYLRLPEIVV